MDPRVEFGLITHPMSVGEEAGQTLRADNVKSLELVREHFQTAWVYDHFQLVSQQVSREWLECWTYLCYLLPHFQTLRFGTLVLGQSYRNPALVAKMAATLHYLSGGRIILGIGAGWKEDEYRAYGYPFPPPAVRARQLDEYAQIVHLMLSRSPASFQGKYYTVEDAYNDPLPLPPIPLLIGGTGERSTLRTTARYADWWNFPWGSKEVFAGKVNVLRQHCAKVGRDFGEIVLTTCQQIDLTGRTKDRPQRMRVIAGDADEVTRELDGFVALGTRHFMLRFVDFPATEGLERFLARVLPHFR